MIICNLWLNLFSHISYRFKSGHLVRLNVLNYNLRLNRVKWHDLKRVKRASVKSHCVFRNDTLGFAIRSKSRRTKQIVQITIEFTSSNWKSRKYQLTTETYVTRQRQWLKMRNKIRRVKRIRGPSREEKSDQLIRDERCAARCSDYERRRDSSDTWACPSEILLFTFCCDNILKA